MAVGRLYTVVFENVTVSAAQDLFEFSVGTNRAIALAGLTLDNVGGTADAGDAQEETLRLAVVTGHATSGSGGTVATPRALDLFDTAYAGVAEVNNTTIASAGTAITRWPFGWNVRVPLREFFPEEFMIWAGGGDGLMVVRLLAAPADGLSVSGCAWIMEG